MLLVFTKLNLLYYLQKTFYPLRFAPCMYSLHDVFSLKDEFYVKNRSIQLCVRRLKINVALMDAPSLHAVV